MTRRDFLSFLPFAPKVVASLSDKRNFIGDEVLERVIQRSRKEGWARLPFGDLVAKVGLSFRGTPYEGWTLERDTDREFCFVTLEALDCVTFFESSLAIARMIRQGQSSPEQLLAQVTRTRYRDGVVGGYPSRLHYTCDWMDDNTRRKNVSKVDLAGAIPFGRAIDFMSKHTNVYRQLKAHPELVREIEATETALTTAAKDRIRYVPTAGVEAIESSLKSGDIVGIVTSIPGMDCSHTGLIVRDGKHARFLHASSRAKQVVLGPRISEYLAESEKAIGLMAVRPL